MKRIVKELSTGIPGNPVIREAVREAGAGDSETCDGKDHRRIAQAESLRSKVVAPGHLDEPGEK
jgi:hypothetical protein